MRDGGRLGAALAVLEDFDTRRVPLKVALADWARGARYAGSKDRAFISGLCLDFLRRKGTLTEAGGGKRGGLALLLKEDWGWAEHRIAAAFADEPHGPGPLTDAEGAGLADSAARLAAVSPDADLPDFIAALLREAGADLARVAAVSAVRAPVDLRVNTLKADRERVLGMLSSYGAEPIKGLADGIRIPASPAADRMPDVTIHPAYLKGYVEVQDAGSQIAATAAGAITGAQVLDFCAGGGGKTLALAALMANSGQLFAYDNDARRLAPLFERARRAGVRNLQVLSPVDNDTAPRLETLREKFDVVFVDAPCSGAGTWRRHPDTKWRLTEDQLERRMAEQDQVLRDAAPYVRPGGRLVYVTCSVLPVENADRIASFLGENQGFEIVSGREAAVLSGALDGSREMGREEAGAPWVLDPLDPGCDGFGITVLERSGE